MERKGHEEESKGIIWMEKEGNSLGEKRNRDGNKVRCKMFDVA